MGSKHGISGDIKHANLKTLSAFHAPDQLKQLKIRQTLKLLAV